MNLPELDSHLPDPADLVVTPDEADTYVKSLEDRPGVEITTWPQRGGRSAYRVTLGTQGKPHVYFTRPHSHEPAGTAACFEWIRRLSSPSDDWSETVLAEFRISFMPDANPSGSQRSPVKFWDGSEIPNEEFFLWMFGESGDVEGERFPRVATWDMREVTNPRILGIAYEQIDEHNYVEPNRDHRSTFFRAYFDLHAQEPVDVWLDLHQTEYVNSEHNTHVNLPTAFEQLESDLAKLYQGLADEIHGRWRAEGANPYSEPRLTYPNRKDQFDFLHAVWAPVSTETLHLVTEVQNNNTRTPVLTQVRLQMAAMDQALRFTRERQSELGDVLGETRERGSS